MLRQPRTLRLLPCKPPARIGIVPRRLFLSGRKPASGRAVEGLNHRRLAQEREEYERMRRNFLAAGAVAGIVSFVYTAVKLKQALDSPIKLDSSLAPTDPLLAEAKRKVVLHDEKGREIVATGNSAVPNFPRTLDLPCFPEEATTTREHPAESTNTTLVSPSAVDPRAEYTLVGLGTRSVSFLGINVYVVGFYVATADIAALQSRLVNRVNPIATTLVSGEKDDLRRALLDPEEGEKIWDAMLREGIPARSVFRVIPVRDTDFHHLRDGFVRAIQGRSDKILQSKQQIGGRSAGADNDTEKKDTFGESMRQFRQAFNRGKVPKSKELLLIREREGALRIVYSGGAENKERQLIGVVDDERVSRALWLNWLGGKKVASEPARVSIVAGVMEFVERPVGTVATQVI